MKPRMCPVCHGPVSSSVEDFYCAELCGWSEWRFPYVWAWKQAEPWQRQSGHFDRDRKGERCRVVARGTMNSATLEFQDGYRVNTSRGGLRRAR